MITGRRTLAGIWALLAAVTPLSAQVSCDLPELVDQLPDQLVEASGIIRDPRSAGVLWLHNDSGHHPSLFAIDTLGQLIGVAPLEELPGIDLEDIALGRCDTGWCFYLGDIGDNLGLRPFITVYRLPLPELPVTGETVERVHSAEATELPAIAPLASSFLRFPGGARDAESLVVDDARQTLILITKGRSGEVGMYTAPLSAFDDPSSTRLLEYHGAVAIPATHSISPHQATSADLSPDGRTLVIRTYVSLYFLEWGGVQEFDPNVIPARISLERLLEPQGEGVTFDLSGTRLYLASEGQVPRPPLLGVIRCARD